MKPVNYDSRRGSILACNLKLQDKNITHKSRENLSWVIQQILHIEVLSFANMILPIKRIHFRALTLTGTLLLSLTQPQIK